MGPDGTWDSQVELIGEEGYNGREVVECFTKCRCTFQIVLRRE
jgi:hypothetical protein